MSTKRFNATEPITALPGVGPVVAQKLARLGITTIKDLLWHLPRTWIDLTQPVPIRSLRRDEPGVIEATVRNPRLQRTKRRRFSVVVAELEDGNGDRMSAVWFNQPFLLRQLTDGSTWRFWGTVGFDFQGRTLQFANPTFTRQASIIPIYPETDGLTSRQIQRLLAPLLASFQVDEYLPRDLLSSRKLSDRSLALRYVHAPAATREILVGRQRLALDELVRLMAVMQHRRMNRERLAAPPISAPASALQQIVDGLPFSLTKSQREAIQEILQDLTKSTPMARLLIGDVGSGKTVVAALAAFAAVGAGYQVAWLAPTQILAEQHFATVQDLFNGYDIEPTLVTAATRVADREGTFLIGTHALLSAKTDLKNVGLVIVDEQHRFGVAQREKLLYARNDGLQPHLLTMTATPIPRSLALTIFGDLDCSFLTELPHGRKPIATRLIETTLRDAALDVVAKELANGRQAYVICPLIETSESSGQMNLLAQQRAVTERYEALRTDPRFIHYRVGLLHGKLDSNEKQRVMNEFSQNKIKLLVATSLVEVGINVPNATVMLIESADRFGLAQLHQLRGRIGRGTKQSLCVVLPSDNTSPQIIERLRAFCSTTDGFRLAELDLAQRGPGDLVGAVQSGLPPLKLAQLTDRVLLQEARSLASELIERATFDRVLAQQFTSFIEEHYGIGTHAD